MSEATWQPIETSPKTGEPILIATHRQVRLVYWADMTIPGWWVKGYPKIADIEPTHWMPVPKVPREAFTFEQYQNRASQL